MKVYCGNCKYCYKSNYSYYCRNYYNQTNTPIKRKNWEIRTYNINKDNDCEYYEPTLIQRIKELIRRFTR